MDKNLLRKDIESLINSIKEDFDNTLDHDDIPSLELAIIVNKIEKLHQKAIVFNYLNDKIQDSVRDQIEVTETSQENILPTLQTDLFGGAIVPKSIAQPSLKVKQEAEQKRETVTDIHTLIGINEKFQFINDLFDDTVNEYNAAINQLNNYNSFTEAESYLNSIKEIYKWDNDNLIVKKFIAIIKRKLKD